MVLLHAPRRTHWQLIQGAPVGSTEWWPRTGFVALEAGLIVAMLQVALRWLTDILGERWRWLRSWRAGRS